MRVEIGIKPLVVGLGGAAAAGTGAYLWSRSDRSRDDASAQPGRVHGRSPGDPDSPPDDFTPEPTIKPSFDLDPIEPRIGGTARVNGTGKVVALTFDDGPGAATPAVLEVLKRNGVTATFFEQGVNVKAHPEWTKQAHDAGHAIGNHSWDHDDDLIRQSNRSFAKQLKATNAQISKVTGEPVELYRSPFGLRSDRNDRVLARHGMQDILWDVDPRDWDRPGARVITSRILDQARDGSIILMHDAGGDRTQTAASLQRTIDKLERRGFSFVTVPELLEAGTPERSHF